MTTQTMPSLSADARPQDAVPVPRAPRVKIRGVLVLLLPPVAALIALAIHRFIPNRQTDIPTHLYPMLLILFIVVGIGVIAIHAARQVLRRGARVQGSRDAMLYGGEELAPSLSYSGERAGVRGHSREQRNSTNRPSPQPSPPSTGEREQELAANNGALDGGFRPAALIDRLCSGVIGWVSPNAPLFAAAILLLCLWDLLTLKLAVVPLPYFPGPDMVLQCLRDDWALIANCTWHSLLLLFTGFASGAILGVVSGVMIGWSSKFRYWGMPVLKVLGPIPATAFIPLTLMLFPTAFSSAVALICLAVWFPVTMLT